MRHVLELYFRQRIMGLARKRLGMGLDKILSELVLWELKRG